MTPEEKALEFANRLEKQTIECPRGCLNPGLFFGYIAGYQELESELLKVKEENKRWQKHLQDFAMCEDDGRE